MARRGLSREERALWHRSMQDVAPLAPKKAPAVAPEEPAPEPRRPRRIEAPPAKPNSPLPALAAGDAPGVDRRTVEKLRRGKLAIEARLDLHGMTQDQAHRALARFVVQAHGAGLRGVLVITGKGSASGERGVLKAAVPRWLNEGALRARILAFSWAQARDGGAGALYLLLRRVR